MTLERLDELTRLVQAIMPADRVHLVTVESTHELEDVAALAERFPDVAFTIVAGDADSATVEPPDQEALQFEEAHLPELLDG